MPKLDETRPFLAVQIGVMTVSDTRTRADDKSGQTLVDLITRDGHKVVDRIIIKDDTVAITAQLEAWISRDDWLGSASRRLRDRHRHRLAIERVHGRERRTPTDLAYAI